jgi:hypothetical protein
VDRDLALAAEQAAANDATSKEKDKSSAGETAAAKSEAGADEGALSKTRYAESVRLGHVLYALPGKYTVEVALNGASADTALEIEAPEARKPRIKAPVKVRGKHGWAGSAVQMPASPYSRERD